MTIEVVTTSPPPRFEKITLIPSPPSRPRFEKVTIILNEKDAQDFLEYLQKTLSFSHPHVPGIGMVYPVADAIEDVLSRALA